MTRAEAALQLHGFQLAGATVRVTWRQDRRYAARPNVAQGVPCAIRNSIAELDDGKVRSMVPLNDVTNIEVMT